jgi:hypothetical protein
VTVCGAESLLVHFTVVPRLTVIVSGENWKLWIEAVTTVGVGAGGGVCDTGAGAGDGGVTGVGVGVGATGAGVGVGLVVGAGVGAGGVGFGVGVVSSAGVNTLITDSLEACGSVVSTSVCVASSVPGTSGSGVGVEEDEPTIHQPATTTNNTPIIPIIVLFMVLIKC